MTHTVLNRDTATSSPLRASVCVIGAGIAGLLAATRLAKTLSQPVIVIESGLSEFDSDIGSFNRIEDLSGIYHGAVMSRSRGLGGTSALWSGKLLPLSPNDAAARPWLGLERWPLDLAELDRYRVEIEALMGVDDQSYEDDASALLDRDHLLPRDDADFVLRWPKRPTNNNHSMAHVLRKAIASSPNLQIWLGATVSSFDVEPSTGRVKQVTAANQAGDKITVVADEFLLAAGTLESTRLLLLADRQANGALSDGCNAYGHYFNDHLGITAATLRPLDHDRTNRTLSDRWIRSAARHLHFELRPDVQREAGTGSAYFDIGVEVSPRSALAASRNLLQSIKRSPMTVDMADMKSIALDLPTLAKTLQWQWRDKLKYWPTESRIQMKIWIEQLPVRDNRIELSDQRDAMGVPLLKLHWRKTEADEACFRATAGKIERFWQQHLASRCELVWTDEMQAPGARLIDLAVDQAHPAGSTRMGLSRADSVVDPTLKVHGSVNLSIASASVFPSSGSANPTLTVMHLAMRAADAITSRLNQRLSLSQSTDTVLQRRSG